MFYDYYLYFSAKYRVYSYNIIGFLFICEVNMPLKGAKKKKYNKKYYADNKQKISEWKKEAKVQQ